MWDCMISHRRGKTQNSIPLGNHYRWYSEGIVDLFSARLTKAGRTMHIWRSRAIFDEFIELSKFLAKEEKKKDCSILEYVSSHNTLKTEPKL